ncbi:hypothetical protein RHECNPAF_890066 [Rhizobium etli CNPAF512]|nr:hypothetical protein RHECNPAF_890066 [Rhizobium etli CNPAF512]
MHVPYLAGTSHLSCQARPLPSNRAKSKMQSDLTMPCGCYAQSRF